MHMWCVNAQKVYGIEAVREAQTAAEARANVGKRHLSDNHPLRTHLPCSRVCLMVESDYYQVPRARTALWDLALHNEYLSPLCSDNYNSETSQV